MLKRRIGSGDLGPAGAHFSRGEPMKTHPYAELFPLMDAKGLRDEWHFLKL
jgi:hypothetical protein